jgi:micrococcal nuclease
MNPNFQLSLVLMTLAATVGAFLLAAYFALRRRLMLAGVCLLCFFALLRPGVVYGAEVCQPTKYADGDTFSFRQAGDLVRVRVAGFDAPERGQPYSRRATEKLRALTGPGALCDCYKQDRHGRSVCTVRTRGGENVAAVMLAAGLGCIDQRFEDEASPADRQAARDALQRAQIERVGMWSQLNPQCAADYRRAQRAQ